MVYYYEIIEHTNNSDDEETVVTLTSTEEEKKHVVSVRLYYEDTAGYLNAYIERERILTHPTAMADIQNYLEIQIDADLPVGQTFKLTLKNKQSGHNSTVVGVLQYEIK